MKSIHVLALAVAGVALTGYLMLSPSLAQQPPAAGPAVNVVAVVNIPKLFREAREIASLKEEFTKAQQELEADAKARKTDLEKRRKDLQENFKPDTKDYKQREQTLLQEAINFDVTVRMNQENLINKHKAKTEAFYAKIAAKVDAVARDEGFQLVLYKEDFQVKDARTPDELLEMIRQRKVLYNSSRADLTETILKKLNDDFTGPAPR